MRSALGLGAIASVGLLWAGALQPAPAYAQDEEKWAFAMCSGRGCCIKGGTKPGQVCVKTPTVTVRTADDTALTKVRIVQRKTKDEKWLWGMADLEGRILVPPNYTSISPVTPRVAWAMRTDDKPVILVDGKERPTSVKEIGQYRARKGPNFVFGVTARHEQYNIRDLAPLLADGTFGPSLKRVMPDEAGIAQVGDSSVLVVSMQDKSGAKGSAFLDASGRVFWAGPETVAYKGDWGVGHNCHTDPDETGYLGQSVSLVLGPSPVDLGDPRLLRPLDARATPLPLPEGVIGLTPVGGANGCASGWVIVSQGDGGFRYQLGWGSPAMVLAEQANLMLLDDVRKAEPTDFGDGRQTEAGANRLIVAKAAGKPSWFVTNEHNPRVALTDKPWDASSIAAADAFIADVWTKVQGRMAERAAREADAQANRAREQAWFDQNIERAKSLDSTERSRLRRIALEDGGARAARYWSAAAERLSSDAGAFCAHVKDACEAVVEKREADMASLLAYQAKRGAIDAAFAAAARPNTNPDVKVTIYEGGRMRTEVMPTSHYDNVYKPKP